jgi:AmmeMemoRadiSam system protein A
MTNERQNILRAIANASIDNALGGTACADASSPWLAEPGASFVTLLQKGELRGCIGTLEAHRPLLSDVRHNARAAALSDPRFSPLTIVELDFTEIQVSLLSPMTPMEFRDEADALAQLRPGVDGIVLEFGYRRATFLPQVWDQLPDPRTFLSQLKRKAGLPGDFWADGVRLLRYGVEK